MHAFFEAGRVWLSSALWQPHSALDLKLGLDRSLPILWENQLLCAIRRQHRTLFSEPMAFAWGGQWASGLPSTETSYSARSLPFLRTQTPPMCPRCLTNTQKRACHLDPSHSVRSFITLNCVAHT